MNLLKHGVLWTDPSQLLPLQVLSPQGRPLPDILNHSFLYVLHDGVKAFLVSHPAAIEKVLSKNSSLILM